VAQAEGVASGGGSGCEAAFGELAELYDRLAEDLEPLAGECRRCGRCCRFVDGFALYTTLLERKYMLRAAGELAPVKSPPKACPFLSGIECTAREFRALGCRTYYCDSANAERRRKIHEKYVREIASISERHGIERDYAALLERLVGGA